MEIKENYKTGRILQLNKIYSRNIITHNNIICFAGYA